MKNKNYFIIFLLVIISSAILFWSFNNYFEYEKKIKIEEILELELQELNQRINHNKDLLLTASVLLAKDKVIIKCQKTKNKDLCIKYLENLKQSLIDSIAIEDIRIHLHDEKLNSFFRLWDIDNTFNDQLQSFRHSLQIVRQNKKSQAIIEVGRFGMLIRGISPILDGDNYLGSIEVITNFDSLIKYYNKKGINLFILMNKDLKNIADKVTFDNKQELANYYIINQISESTNFLDNSEFIGTGYLQKESYYLLYTPIFDVNSEIIGAYVLQLYKK